MGAVPAADVVENPVTGERVAVREHTDGVLRFDYALAPGGFSIGRAEHAHPRQVEQLRVRSGRLRLGVEGEQRTLRAGDRVTIPPHAAHALRNETAEPVEATVELRPALRSATFFRTTFGLARDGRTNDRGVPRPLHLAVILDAFREEIYLAALPRTLQLGLAALFGPVGRLRGYRARYDRYEPAERGSAAEPERQ